MDEVPAIGFDGSLVLPFRSSSGQHYLYDAPSNEIVRVSPKIWDCAAHGIAKDDDDICAFVEAQRAAGLFSTNRPDEVSFLISRADLENKLANEIDQLVLEMTTACNLRCKYCTHSGHYKNRRPHGSATMDLDTASRAIEFFLQRNANAGHCSIGFYGGEPTLNWKTIAAAVDYAKKRASRPLLFAMTTNGYGLSERIDLRFLVENRFSLLISLDGPENKHDSYRIGKKSKPTFKEIIKTLKALRALDGEYVSSRVSISIVIAPPYDFRELMQFFDNDEAVEGVNLRLSFVSPEGTTFFDDEDVKAAAQRRPNPGGGYEEVRGLYLDYLRAETPFRSPFLRALFQGQFLRLHKRRLFPNQYGKAIWSNGCCTPGVRRIYVKATGDFAVCEKVDDTLTIGGLDDGFDMTKVDNIMRKYTERSSVSCPHCVANRLCSACFAVGFSQDGFNVEDKNERCRDTLASLEEVLVDYCSVLESNPNAFDFMSEISVS